MSDNDLIRRGDAKALMQRAVDGYGQKMRGATDKKEKRDWQSMLFAAVDIDRAIADLPAVTPAPDAAAIREAALREAADLVNRRVDGVRVSIPCPDGKSGCLVHHFRIEDGPTAKAILALITEKPHDR